MENLVPIVIPAYVPDDRLLTLLDALTQRGQGPILLIDDGSGNTYAPIFNKAAAFVQRSGGSVLIHETNRGKGRALKTAFAYVLEQYPDAVGVVTADSDGQHSPACIAAVADALREHTNSLVLGVRSFDGEDVPWKSRIGNNLTMKVLGYVSGLHISDTQTGLRGIPVAFMRELLSVPGDRFEFETEMLLESVGRWPVVEVPIQTIYDSRENHQTHFDPFRDSLRIYRIIAKKFVKYLFASLSSSVVDIMLFAVFCGLLRTRLATYVAVSTVLARLISASYNYAVNYKVVFKSKEHPGMAAARYAALAVVQMACSALLVSGGVALFRALPEVVVKIVVDVLLFFVSYHIQQNFVFNSLHKTEKRV